MNFPEKYIPYAAALGGAVIGFGVGYYVGHKIKVHYAPVAQYIYTEVDTEEVSSEIEEVDDVKNPIFVSKLVIDPEVAEQIDAKVRLNQTLEAVHEYDDEHGRQAVNVFTVAERSDLPEWDQEAQMAQRTPDKPYVISKDEFMDAESGYSQDTVTYYLGDDILADATDIPIWNWPEKLGSLHFGLGSDDPNVVYIRNDFMHQEWEVLKHSGSYEIEVGGLSIEQEYEEQDLKHSNSLHKFREY